jgi:hypothetical protein
MPDPLEMLENLPPGVDVLRVNWLTAKAWDIKPKAQKIPVTLMGGAGIDLEELPSLKGVIEGLIAKLLPLQDHAANARDEGR